MYQTVVKTLTAKQLAEAEEKNKTKKKKKKGDSSPKAGAGEAKAESETEEEVLTTVTEKITVGRVTEGNIFGELAVLYPRKRAVSVAVESRKAKLWSLDRATYKRLMAQFTDTIEKERLRFLARAKVLKPLQKWERQLLVQGLHLEKYEKGDKLVVEGDVHKKLFIITKGEVAVTQENEIGRPVELCRLGVGRTVGEHAVITRRACQASVRVISPKCEVLSLRKKVFHRLVGRAGPVLERDTKLRSEVFQQLL